jgi:hypothetical protein
LPCRDVSMLLKSHALPDKLPFSHCNKKRLAIRHMNRPLSNDTIDCILWHQEVGRTKDLSAPHRIFISQHGMSWYGTGKWLLYFVPYVE